jgi:hypothetical protein
MSPYDHAVLLTTRYTQRDLPPFGLAKEVSAPLQYFTRHFYHPLLSCACPLEVSGPISLLHGPVYYNGLHLMCSLRSP